ncbi:hypothetical protein MOQ72_42870 [Saccharopolyspora sp. K220]|uniref:hypothetical protein n=1 Tax=Saccharopolyspora soli TaxID=2926618 RepID=UPI001F571036|nr:hypothetical protein [Saccharopolyspora soli]MCI2424158.1 hypothetical protein [Saccharopolyspora soli]
MTAKKVVQAVTRMTGGIPDLAEDLAQEAYVAMFYKWEHRVLLHRHLDRADVLAALRAAATVGATSPDVVAVEARRIAEARTPAETAAVGADPVAEKSPKVVSLTERRLADPQATVAALPSDARPLPSVEAYDELLARRRPLPTASASSPSPTAGEVS